MSLLLTFLLANAGQAAIPNFKEIISLPSFPGREVNHNVWGTNTTTTYIQAWNKGARQGGSHL
jgi:hypothetical protein